MLIDLTLSEMSGGLRIDAPGLSFKDLVPILRGQFPDGWIVFLDVEDFRGQWPPTGARITNGRVEIAVEPFMEEVESLLLEGGGPLFHRIAFSLLPEAPVGPAAIIDHVGFDDSDLEPPPAGVAGPPLPPVPDGGLSFASEDDFLAAIGVPEEEALHVFGILFRAVYVDHPPVARGLARDDAARLLELAREAGGIHFNPEKWRADPEGRVSLANLGREFHCPCHNAPTEGKVQAIRLTETGDRLLVAGPFAMSVDEYLDRWYDRPVGCRRFIQAGLVGGLVIFILLVILFITRR
jgi:hypothetical protein